MNTFVYPVDCSYGAPMGRRTGPEFLDTSGKIYLRRIRLNSGGYDNGGAYWGLGQPLWETQDQDGNGLIFRESDRESAKNHIRNLFPAAKFYR